MTEWSMNVQPRPEAAKQCALGNVQFGAVAHLGERFHGMEEAMGSNPISSTGVQQTEDHHTLPLQGYRIRQ